ncbi:MAG: glycosyltransferase [Saprospiraceae bacterium]|nr:glycosyltransferase [Saprospiraceae bacterium]
MLKLFGSISQRVAFICMTIDRKDPVISIVTVCLNSADYIEECIKSVIDQGYPALEYIIVDGGSTDGTLEILEKYSQHIHLISEPDSGPANALNKGLSRATGEVMGWLNSDDKLHPGSIGAVTEVFNTFPNIKWIMGYPTWFTATGACVKEMSYPRNRFYRNPGFINDSMHLKFARWSKWRFAMDDYSSIQQESVFWKRELWNETGGYVIENGIAYDLELWTRFFLKAELYTCDVLIGGFRVHGNQVSLNGRDQYITESKEHIKRFKSKLPRNRIRIWIGSIMRAFYYYNIPVLKGIYPKSISVTSSCDLQ